MAAAIFSAVAEADDRARRIAPICQTVHIFFQAGAPRAIVLERIARKCHW
jgi:hypothetical protein